LALTLLLASVTSPIFAGQLLEGRPDDALTATVSRNEPNLIRVDGGKIRRIHGVEGEFVVSADRETGAAYLKPTTEQPQFSVFVADDAGRHWKLLLTPPTSRQKRWSSAIAVRHAARAKPFWPTTHASARSAVCCSRWRAMPNPKT
jgi:hypothetical protein